MMFTSFQVTHNYYCDILIDISFPNFATLWHDYSFAIQLIISKMRKSSAISLKVAPPTPSILRLLVVIPMNFLTCENKLSFSNTKSFRIEHSLNFDTVD